MTNIDHLSHSQPTETITETPAQRLVPTDRRTHAAVSLLLLTTILLLGAYFRLLNVDWDEGEHLHPDERYMTMVTGAIRSPDAGPSPNPPVHCTSWGSYFDSYCSPLNPYNHQGYGSYAYGTFPLFTTRVIGEWLNGACTDPTAPDANSPDTISRILTEPKKWIASLLFDDAKGCVGNRFTDYGHVHLLGRMLSALVDLGTVLLTFLIGRRLYGSWVGLLAAALYTFAALPIQQSHFYTVDSFAAFFVTLAAYFAVLASQHGRWRDFSFAGLAFGLAIASKVSIWPFAAVIALAALLFYVRSNTRSTTHSQDTGNSTGPSHILDWLMILLAVILCFLIGAIALFGIWSAVKIAFFFALVLLLLGAVAFYALRPGATRLHGSVGVDGVVLRLFLAGIVTFLAFRAAQPYAFVGTNFDDNKWQAPEYDWLRANVPDIWYTVNDKLPEPIRALFLPDPRFISTLGSVTKQLTGEQDVPWGHQWTNRLPFVFPWINLVVWGMGLPLGLTVWVGWLLAGWELWRGTRRMRHFIPWAWGTILFFYQGTQWVKSIRYLLPIYPFLIILGAWFLARLWQKARGTTQSIPIRRFRAGLYRFPLVFVVAATFLWAWGFTRIYAQPVTRNTASRWMMKNIPTAVTLHYEADGEQRSQPVRMPPTYTYASDGFQHVTSFVVPEDAAVTGITFAHLSDPERDATPETFRIRLTADVNGESVVAQAERSFNLELAWHRLGDPQYFDLDSAQLQGNREYYLITQATAGAPIGMDTTVIANEYPDDSLPTRVDGSDPFGGSYRGLESSGDGKTHWDLNEDSSKVTQAVEWLDEADIIALSSNRGYASIPRLPSRYPMAIEFYRALFAEELGFDLIASFGSYPTIGPFQFPDQETPFSPSEPSLIGQQSGSVSVWLPPAEEAFSVYDHPQVFLFQKTDAYSRQRAEDILGGASSSQTVWMKPTEATLAPTALMHTEEELSRQRRGGTWTDNFDANDWLNRWPLVSVLVWSMLMLLLGLVAFPFLFVAAPALRDRGWPLARALGLLLLAFVVWWVASSRLATYSRPAIFNVLVVLTFVSGGLAWRKRYELVAWFAQEWRTILVSELLFNAMFILFLLIRYGNPDLWHPAMGGERPMDFAYLNAVIKSSSFPPYDPWFAGGYLNYYYFGFVLVGTPIKLLGVLPEIAYNLILPTFFALTGVGAFSVAFNLVARVPTGGQEKRTRYQTPNASRSTSPINKHAVYAGLIAALFVAVLGNMGEITLVADGLHELGSRDFDFQSTIPGLEPLVISLRGLVKHTLGGETMPWRPEWPYWNASRAIPHPQTEAPPITEFPFFTFLYSDLHAHLLVLPMTLLALAFILNWSFDAGFWRQCRSADGACRRSWVSPVLGLILGGIVIGSLRPTNTWDYATYLALAPLALIVGFATHATSVRDVGWNLSTVRNAVSAIGTRFAVLAALSYALYLPYITRYATASTGFELWKGSKTPLWAYFGVHGLFLFPFFTWLLIRMPWARPFRQSQDLDASSSAALAAASGSSVSVLPAAVAISMSMATLFAFVAGYRVAVIVLPFGTLALLHLVRRETDVVERLAALMGGVGLALTLVVELLVLNEGDVSRMNTVFKFYLQAWILLGITAAVCLIWVRRRFLDHVEAGAPAQVGTDVPSIGAMVRPLVPDEKVAPLESGFARSRLPYRGGWTLWTVVLALLIAGAALYPLLATRAKINDRWARQVGPGLDSLEWMKTVNDVQFGPGAPDGKSFPILSDYLALMWLRENVKGSPVVAEGAKAPPYRSLRARVATYTGLPIIIGYPWHQKQQRSFLKTDVIGQRERDVNSLYGAADPWLAKEILDRYDVSLLYVGELERVHYSPDGIQKFAQMADMGLLSTIYTNDGVTIYEVVR